jgi:hypothetical protein
MSQPERVRYWADVTQRIYETLGFDGQYVRVWHDQDIILDGSFDVEDVEAIARMVKEAKQNEPK